jgi:hypothetical protein
MGLDIRVPLGLLFTVIGALLAIFGALSDGSIYARSLNINVNLWWGLVMAGFGVVFLWFSWRRAATPQSSAEQERSVKGATTAES